MKYMGSKLRIAEYILPIMLREVNKKGIKTWAEPFVGGANMIDKVPKNLERIGIDKNPHTVAALIAIRDFVHELPDQLSEDEYRKLKGCDPEPIKSWLRFVNSFGGKFDAGYARNAKKDNYCLQGKRSAQRQSPNLQGVEFINASYDEYSHFENCLIYCDPPYQGTTKYATGDFNHSEFWDWCRKMSENNSVFVSEYTAPDDFTCVWQMPIRVSFSSQRTQSLIAIEKLYKYKK